MSFGDLNLRSFVTEGSAKWPSDPCNKPYSLSDTIVEIRGPLSWKKCFLFQILQELSVGCILCIIFVDDGKRQGKLMG